MKPKQKISMEPLFPVNGKFVMLSALLIGILVATTQAQDQKAVKPSAAAPASATSLGSRDAIYIDDDTIEGSGGRGGIHEDLEKDPDYSGSGFGPDDEDAEPDQHSHTSHNTRISQNIGGGINTAHLPPQTSSTTSTTTTTTTTTVPTTTTKTPPTSSTTTTTTTTIAASSTTSTTPTPTQVGNGTTPATPTNQPIMPAFDKDLDLSAGSGDKIYDTDDDEDDDDIFDHSIDEGIEKEGEIDIDPPVSQTPVLSGKTRIDNDNDNDDNGDDDDDGTIDVDGEEEYENGGVTGTISTGGNAGDIFTERGPGGADSNVHGLDPNTNVNSQPSDTKSTDHRLNGNEVVIMSEDDRTSSFFSQPGILAAVIGGAVVGLLCAILVVMFIVYRMRKKDEGSYALDEPKRSPANNSYAKNANNREFYA